MEWHEDMFALVWVNVCLDVTMRLKRAVVWGFAIIIAGIIGLYAEFVRETAKHDPAFLLACSDVDPLPLAWTCKQVLVHRTFPAEEIKELNSVGGAVLPVYVKNSALAEEMLSLFVARGVDINAGDERTRRWTALHSMAMEPNPERITMLLRHGALANVRDTTGMTPADVARQLQQKSPSDPTRAEVVRLLEEAERQQVPEK